MGMYTGLRFKVTLNDEGLSVVKSLNSAPAWTGRRWFHVLKEHNHLPWLRRWAFVGRADCVPFGIVLYMPDDWEDNACDLDGRVWNVCCSLKNYEGEIQQFLEDVLPYMVSEPCEAEVLYEEDEEPSIAVVEPKTFDMLAYMGRLSVGSLD